ncbi:hypothetical protein J6590_071770 [Homalodisca vitripennis]|nr:hypothetical protein J6590_071770 [Homalodisca vitripennis]
MIQKSAQPYTQFRNTSARYLGLPPHVSVIESNLISYIQAIPNCDATNYSACAKVKTVVLCSSARYEQTMWSEDGTFPDGMSQLSS